MIAINIENVVTTYSGGTGCACGCKGTYAYPENTTVAESQWGTLSDRTVKSRLKKVNDALVEDRLVYLDNWFDGSCYEIQNDEGTRVVRIYVDTVTS